MHFEARHLQNVIGAQPMHCHEEIEIATVCRGNGVLRHNGTRLETHAGRLSVLCPQEPHAGIPGETDFEVKTLNVSWSWFDGAGLDWRKLQRKSPLYETPTVIQAFLTLHDSILQNESALAQEAQLLRLYSLLADEPSVFPLDRFGAKSKPIVQSLEILHKRFAEPLTLIELANLVELTPWHFCRTFHQVVGMTPHAYQNSLRVARAKTLLNTGKNPGEVAVEVGFYDQSHLTGHCKRLLGVTPSLLAKTAISS